MNSTVIIISLAALALVMLGLAIHFARKRTQARVRIERLYEEIMAASHDASVGRRLIVPDDPETAQIATTVNRLFDALGERDQKIQDRDRLFHDFARALPEIVFVHTEKILLANEAAADLVGLEPGQLAGRDVADLVRPAYRALFRKTITKRLAGEDAPRRIEMQLINGNQAGLWVEAQSSSIDYAGQQAILTIARDISHRKSLEVSLSRSKRQAQYTLESIAEGVITTDNDGRIDYMNLAAETLLDTNRDDATGHRIGELFALVDDADRRNLPDPVERCLAMRRRVNMGRRAVLITADGEHEHSIELTASPIRGPSNTVSGAVVVFHDVSELRGLTRKMSYQATHDQLTGLINRHEFDRRLEEAIDTAHAEEAMHMLFYMDLDRFKAVNDSCGHIAGDNMLREVAAIIKDQVRESDFVGRLGGDEFGALLIGCPIDKARQIANDICNAVADYRFVWKDKIFNIGISIGLVEISHASGSVQDIMSAADSACYVAKQSGRGQVHVYSARDEAVARERGDIQWLRQLQTALHEDKFELAVQPIISMHGHAETGPAVEVLIRLDDAIGRASDSAEFLRPAERYQLTPQIDRWVVNASLAAISSGEIKLSAHRSCAINLSGQTLGDEAFLGFVVEALDRSGVAPSTICFEVTETAILANVQHAQRFIEVLHGIGCSFSLDDFGSGLGSFSSLKHLPIDYLKIDGTYTRNLQTDLVNQEMVSAMIKLARTMDFKVVAEQVEHQEDFDWLREVGVDFVQGYFVEAPVRLGSGMSGTYRALTP
ncbi:MAG: EAL domain-containing protein [Gammaproteobacteria bacterium]|nr:EAL domain-containing protein [Gammaproteobacteria bacterium]NNF50574.1 EAL domain-containing protein [Woeseiaceae bacterium]MBT8094643.1 EAL domain-containing protein [Gammaproteobacteria bacterium]MBT8106407.1 EAL domain-containing protein [Gammaproteobacteria bacterium]NNK26422.1 EAL domain-containing protein [Woeseiaceae bacterium]